MKPVERLLFMYGSPGKAAKALGIKHRQTIESWVKCGYIPYVAAYIVEKGTGGAITRKQVWFAADEARGLK